MFKLNAQGGDVKTLILSANDMATLVERVGLDQLMDTMIERLRNQFDQHDDALVDVRTRDGFHYDKPALGLIEWMPVHEVGGPVVIKMVGYHPTNPLQRALPSVLATSSMWDSETGHLVAVADATLLTAIRTAAASAVATDILANPRTTTVGIVGLGAQSVAQLHALTRVRPIERVIAYDNSSDARDTFSDRVAFLGLDIEVVDGDALDRLVASSDVLVTCTSVDIGAGPVVPETDTQPWLHVNAVGADFPGKTELPLAMLEAATVVPDCRPQCIAEGECQVLDPSKIGPDAATIVKSAQAFHELRTSLTVFDSTGWAIEDEVALRLALELAEEHGLGHQVQIESISADPLNPYEGLTRFV